MDRFWGWAQQGGLTVTTQGVQSANNTLVQRTYPGATVTVYVAGSNNLATIYSDNNSTPLANPFTANNNTGYYDFYAAAGRYDVQFSGNNAGIPSPFTLPDVTLVGALSINNQSGPNITIQTGNSGNNFNVAAANNNITLNLPQADANNNGYLSANNWAIFNNKSANLSFTAPLSVSNNNVSLATPLAIVYGGSNGNNKTQGFTNLSPITTKGDIIAGDNNGVPVRIPVGANNGLALLVDGANTEGVAWGQVSLSVGVTGVLPIANGGSAGNNKTAAFTNLSPLTTLGDIIAANATGIPIRVAVGADGTLLQGNNAAGAGVSWGAANLSNANTVTGVLPIARGGTGANNAGAAFTSLSPITAKGDLIAGNNNNIAVRLPVGTPDTYLRSNNANATNLEWAEILPLFAQNNSVTVGNTVTETSVVGSGAGSMALPANFFIEGRSLVLRAAGFHSSVANPDIRWRVKLDGVTFLDSGNFNTGAGNNESFLLEALFTCRSAGNNGTFIAQGSYIEFGTNSVGLVMLAPANMNTEGSLTLDVSAEWGTANATNTLTVTNLLLTRGF